MNRVVDFSALTAPVTADQVRTFRRSVSGNPAYASQFGVGAIIVLIFVFGFIAVFFVGFATLAIGMIAGAAESGFTVATLVQAAFPLLFVVVFVIVAVLVIRGALGGGRRWERWYRLSQFATANSLEFSPRDADPAYPGAIFTAGRSRVALEHLRRPTKERFFDYGTFRYVTGSGKNSTTHTWGFLALRLDRALPHMVLDSRANNRLFGGTNLPTIFAKDQVLSLEGDFDKYFTLYCPREYETDALYVFTPDLMALAIDEAAPFDIEIIDSWMFVYSAAAFDLTQPAWQARILRIVDTVGAKTLAQTDRYVDERVSSGSAAFVAPQGRRLRPGLSIGAIIMLVAFAAFGAWSILSDALAGVLP